MDLLEKLTGSENISDMRFMSYERIRVKLHELDADAYPL